jgi:arsenate reductase
VHAADVIVTVGCGNTSRIYPGTPGQDIHPVRPLRDKIKRRVEQLIGELRPIS